MNTIFILIIVLVLIGVANTVLIVILLSYKNEEFNHFLDNKSLQIDFLERIENSICQIENRLENLTDLNEVKNEIESIANKINDINVVINNLNKKEGEEQTVKKNAYDDAVLAFDNINRKFYEIRRYPNILLGLADMLISGNVEGKVDFKEMPDENKQFSANLQSDIMMFNRNYRKNIIDYLHYLGKEWSDCVRNPYNKPFDNEWDEDALGDDIKNGEIVSRIVQLGYEFPNSVKIGRTKSKTLGYDHSKTN